MKIPPNKKTRETAVRCLFSSSIRGCRGFALHPIFLDCVMDSADCGKDRVQHTPAIPFLVVFQMHVSVSKDVVS